jgi:3-oxoacyl-[acyl-carrier-protein] synthase II
MPHTRDLAPKIRRVAITGMGAVSPNGVGLPAFTAGLRTGASGVRTIQSFDPSHYATRIGGEVVGFDAASVVPEPQERKHLSRAAAMVLAASDEALATARLPARDLPLEERRRFGVSLGTGGGGFAFTEKMYDLWYGGHEKKASVYTIAASTHGTIASEISMRHALRGPSHVLSTGCTSSTDAIGHALLGIRHGREDRALVGGTDAPFAPGIFAAFSVMRIMTPSWNEAPERGSRPFSADRDGFVLGEGAWMLLLEEMEIAIERSAPILAELRGYGSTCEAFHRVRLGEDGIEPARAMTLAMEDAGVGPSEVDYVNLHGTSTILNDRIETRALKLALGGRAGHAPASSLKSMIGHPQGACGAAGVVATILGMRGEFFPPTINLDAPDPECDLDYVPKAARRGIIRTALCNCIGFGSKNSALVLGTPER